MKSYTVKLTDGEIAILCLSMGAFIGLQVRDEWDKQSIKANHEKFITILDKFNKAKGIT
jgi:hypothetical protein